jgi:hypothetical protein
MKASCPAETGNAPNVTSPSKNPVRYVFPFESVYDVDVTGEPPFVLEESLIPVLTQSPAAFPEAKLSLSSPNSTLSERISDEFIPEKPPAKREVTTKRITQIEYGLSLPMFKFIAL